MAGGVCFADGCGERVGPNMLMCRDHWRRVPGDVRERVFNGLDIKERTGNRTPWARAAMDAKRAVA